MARTKVCAQPGCPNLAPCPDHRPARTPKARDHHTNRRTWKTTATTYRAKHPTCAACGNPTEQADHIIPRLILEAAGINNPDHERWLQPLCLRCHGRKTRAVDTPHTRRLGSTDPKTLAADAETAAQAWLATTRAWRTQG